VYKVLSYWIEGPYGEITKEISYDSLTEAEYISKENYKDPNCTHSVVIYPEDKTTRPAKIDCAYCNN